MRLVQQSYTQSSGRAARAGKGAKKAFGSWGQGNPKAFDESTCYWSMMHYIGGCFIRNNAIRKLGLVSWVMKKGYLEKRKIINAVIKKGLKMSCL